MADGDAPVQQQKLLHKTIKKITHDTGELAFNTAIAQMMIFVNELFPEETLYRSVWEPFVLLIAPYVPHLGEDLWKKLGRPPSISNQPWPAYDDKLTRDEEVTVVVQVNGKIRARIDTAAGTAKDRLQDDAFAHPRIRELVDGKTVVKVIVVPDKLVNIVVR